jgi:AraC-like DNA-binding protein
MQHSHGLAVICTMTFKPVFDLYAAIILFGVFQAFLLAGVFARSGRDATAFLLAGLMMVLAMIELESFLNYTGFIIYWPQLINISPPLIFTLGPLAYLYHRRVLGAKLRMTWPLHFAPAFAYLCYSFFFYLQPASFRIYAVMKDIHPDVAVRAAKIFPTDPLHIQGWIVIEGLAIHLLLYTGISLYSALTGPRHRHSEWATFLAANLLLGSILFLLTGGVVNGHVLFHPVLPSISVNIYSTVLVYSITVYWLCKITPGLYQKKYLKSELPVELRKQKLEQVRRIMQEERLYRKTDFGLAVLSDRLSVSSHHLSQIINSGMGITFVEFVNQCRIDEARRILTTPELCDIKVEALAYDLGYHSKSAFFNAFRRYTQTTPARYREQHRA